MVGWCRLEFEAQAQRDKQRERDAWEREIRDLREMEFVEKLKQEMELKLPGEYGENLYRNTRLLSVSRIRRVRQIISNWLFFSADAVAYGSCRIIFLYIWHSRCE